VIDTHAHLDACAAPPEEVVARARAAGVRRIITIGTGIESSRAAVALAEREDAVFAVVGIDPHRAASADADRVAELRPLLGRERAVAVGETGLDYARDEPSRRSQQALFEAQLALAEELGKPVVIHSRDADAATTSTLARFDGTVVLHCFSSTGLLPAALERGYYVSFAGNVTYPRSGDLRAAAARVPADRILAETDSPYLAPQPRRGQANEPAFIVHTLATLAAARRAEPDELAAAIEWNAARAFGLVPARR
jgi:TatD DNase family protein